MQAWDVDRKNSGKKNNIQFFLGIIIIKNYMFHKSVLLFAQIYWLQIEIANEARFSAKSQKK